MLKNQTVKSILWGLKVCRKLKRERLKAYERIIDFLEAALVLARKNRRSS